MASFPPLRMIPGSWSMRLMARPDLFGAWAEPGRDFGRAMQTIEDKLAGL